MAIRIHPFLTVMDKDLVYNSNNYDVTILRHSAWLSNHWDDLINEQNRFKERGIFIATEKSPNDIEFEIQWLPLKNIPSISSEYIRERILPKVSDMDIRNEFVIYFTSPELSLDMCYHIPLARLINILS